MRPITRRSLTVAVVAATAVLSSLSGTATAGADRGTGARSQVVGRGDIVTQILGWNTGRASGTASSRCWWRTFRDAELEWMAAASAHQGASGQHAAVLDQFVEHLGGGVLPDGDLQMQICGGRLTDLRFVEPVGGRDPVRLLSRRMITHLPVPDPVISPPPTRAVPVGQPVFISVAPGAWREVGGSITVDGLTAEVRAVPVQLRVITGDPTSPTTTCPGPGTPFDPDDPRSPRQQAADPAACVVSYGSATSPGRSGSTTRPRSWVGTVTVVWSAEWRTGDGPWVSLGRIPRTRLIERSVRELTTTIERG